MLQARIRVDAREYLLPAGHDVEAMKTEVTALVRAGGGFVEIARTPDRGVSVLVSPGMSLSIEVTHVDDEPAASDAEIEESWYLQSSLDPFDVL